MTDDSRRRRIAARGAVAAAVLALPMTASVCYSVGSPALAAEAPELSEVVLPVGFDGEEKIATRAKLAFLDTEAMAADLREQVELQHEQAAEARERAHELREEAHRLRERAHAAREAHVEKYAEGRKQWAEGRIQYARGRQQWADGRIQWADGRVEHSKAEAKRAIAHAEAGEWEAELGEAIGESVAASVAVAMSHVPEVVESCKFPDRPVTTIQKDGKPVMFICDTAGDRMALKALEHARRGIASDAQMSDEMRREILRDLDAEIRELKRTVRS